MMQANADYAIGYLAVMSILSIFVSSPRHLARTTWSASRFIAVTGVAGVAVPFFTHDDRSGDTT